MLKVPGVSWVREVEREHSKHRELDGQLIPMIHSLNQQLFSEHLLCVGAGLSAGERAENE